MREIMVLSDKTYTIINPCKLLAKNHYSVEFMHLIIVIDMN